MSVQSPGVKGFHLRSSGVLVCGVHNQRLDYRSIWCALSSSQLIDYKTAEPRYVDVYEQYMTITYMLLYCQMASFTESLVHKWESCRCRVCDTTQDIGQAVGSSFVRKKASRGRVNIILRNVKCYFKFRKRLYVCETGLQIMTFVIFILLMIWDMKIL